MRRLVSSGAIAGASSPTIPAGSSRPIRVTPPEALKCGPHAGQFCFVMRGKEDAALSPPGKGAAGSKGCSKSVAP
ncbi:hypothetical protein GCM10011491_41520 [Brucella endophytica]|uniref:Uncharacterized protein n=1 Tax=Brucella endophytica TaxID=1963359 RepID=A0A916SNP1_9HYPH|nr:hypothetical protein GCM10011491_41520 [Brucella endophytica]